MSPKCIVFSNAFETIQIYEDVNKRNKLMQFRVADTFTGSLARLTGEDQKIVKTTAFDLQLNPASPGMQSHKLDKAKGKHFWSVRVGSDLRLIVHVCYVDYHDHAYHWAERRKLGTHFQTGAAQKEDENLFIISLRGCVLW